MEVHHHPHVEKKSFKEYLLEGLMIFVAVSMGFIAENIREKIVENERGNEYMLSMHQDLKADTAELNRIIKYKQNDIIYYDSLFYLLKADRTKAIDIYFYLRILPRQNFFYRVDGTNKQLENAGGFRLIHDRAVIDSLHAYTRTYNELKDLENLEQETINMVKEKAFKIADGYVYDKMTQTLDVKRLTELYPLLNFTYEDLNAFHIVANALKRIRFSELNLMDKLQLQAKNLMLLLNKEYHLKEKE
jgi:hypothetical protein